MTNYNLHNSSYFLILLGNIMDIYRAQSFMYMWNNNKRIKNKKRDNTTNHAIPTNPTVLFNLIPFILLNPKKLPNINIYCHYMFNNKIRWFSLPFMIYKSNRKNKNRNKKYKTYYNLTKTFTYLHHLLF